jgi:hypothetical protein
MKFVAKLHSLYQEAHTQINSLTAKNTQQSHASEELNLEFKYQKEQLVL